jgi:hypothetical protein
MQSKRGIHTEADAPVYAQYIAALHVLAADARGKFENTSVLAGLGRIVALYCRSSTSYQPLYTRIANKFGVSISEATNMRPNPRSWSWPNHDFGWAIKAALGSGLVTTSHAMVVQHDHAFFGAFGASLALCVMGTAPHVRCILAPTKSSMHHADQMRSRHGIRVPPAEEHCGATVHPLAFF